MMAKWNSGWLGCGGVGCRGLPLLVVGGETPALAKNKPCLRQPENDVSTFSGCLYNNVSSG
ncbi:hypothetical protein [Kingella sp. (in: b-proteobacteria)]|uniref:hypothetical protein n=1 Tax=Kingella sp. (in: b-proteobacteria) TaxID=2020713 RepID=UPI0026DAF2C4|nr:hypothetical protein [Kingella sp. (in: b-proteobacteria)]MDO4658704.1 hypothetical protein [Kingella sp. (in: b-proteobacteria)]